MRFPEELLVFMMRIFLVQPVPRSLCTAYTAWLKVRMITRGQMLRDFLDDFSHTSSIGFIWQCLIWKWQEEHIKHEPKATSSKTASVTWVVTWTVTYIILHTSSPNTNPGLKRPPIGVTYMEFLEFLSGEKSSVKKIGERKLKFNFPSKKKRYQS